MTFEDVIILNAIKWFTVVTSILLVMALVLRRDE